MSDPRESRWFEFGFWHYYWGVVACLIGVIPLTFLLTVLLPAPPEDLGPDPTPKRVELPGFGDSD